MKGPMKRTTNDRIAEIRRMLHEIYECAKRAGLPRPQGDDADRVDTLHAELCVEMEEKNA